MILVKVPYGGSVTLAGRRDWIRIDINAIVKNKGQVSNGNGVYNAILGPTATDAEVLFSGSLSHFRNTDLGAVLRWSDTHNGYKASINGTSLMVQKNVKGATTLLGSAPFTATAGTSYTVRFRAVGTALYARVWQTGTIEPANWMITVTDSSFSSGYCGLRMQVTDSATASYTSFLATVPGGTPAPSSTIPPGSTLAQDTFRRPQQALWGTASDGQTWGADANVQSVFSIVNGLVQIGIDAPTGFRCRCTTDQRGSAVRVQPVGVRILALEQDGEAVVLGVNLPRGMRLHEGAGLQRGPLGKGLRAVS